MTIYRIRDWEQHFEKAQTRACKIVSWVPLPNKHDGKGFRRIIRLPDGIQIYGAWVLIVQVASKCPERGVLCDADGALSAEDLSDKTGCPRSIFDRALKVLCSKEVAWIDKSDVSDALSADYEPAVATGQDRTGQDKTEQIPPTEVCPEPSGDDSKQSSADEQEAVTAKMIMVFPCVGRGPTEWRLTDAKLAEYQNSFPAVDVLGECRKARQWCIDNAAKRKTAKGMPAFLTRWFSRIQDHGGNLAGHRGVQVPATLTAAEWAAN